jgi:hypothetical protein
MDHRFFITLQAVRRQLAAMPCDLYRLRLIHHRTRSPFPTPELWTAVQLSYGFMVRLLRLRNREGYDVYVQPYAGDRNTGYILLDLDHPDPQVLPALRANGHQPCVLLHTSPGHLQAWLRISETPLEPAVATQVGKQLARAYGGDLASTDWRHLGRLAGFTNQKPARRQLSGYGPWVKLLHAEPCLASQGASLVEAAERRLAAQSLHGLPSPRPHPESQSSPLTSAGAVRIYSRWLNWLRIPQCFSQPDWSIADLWIAKELLRCRVPTDQLQAVLRLGSPGFPRRHADPDDYLRRTLQRAARDLEPGRFPARHATPGGSLRTPARAGVGA